MSNNHEDEEIHKKLQNLFSNLEKAIGKPLDSIFDSLDTNASDEALLDEFLVKSFEEKKKKVAKDLNQIEIATIMLLSGYLIDPKLKNHSSSNMLKAVASIRGIEAFAEDMRENGMEVSFDQVAEAVDNVMSYIIEFGLASVHHGMMTMGVDCTPPKSRKQNFGDIGIEDPFKDSPEA